MCVTAPHVCLLLPVLRRVVMEAILIYLFLISPGDEAEQRITPQLISK